MLGNPLIFSVHLHGTLAANASGRFKIPLAATLKEVQGSASNDSSALLDFGTAADPDGILSAVAIGDSEAILTFDNDDWDGDLYTAADPSGGNSENLQYAEDTVFEWMLDYDGASGTAAQNVSLHFIFEA
jgi:hypothetical protein